MARFRLIIDFDDSLAESEGPEYAQLAASTAVFELKRSNITVENAELIDHAYIRAVDGHEFDDLLPCEVVE